MHVKIGLAVGAIDLRYSDERASLLGHRHGEAPVGRRDKKMRKALVIEDVPELTAFVIAVFERLGFEAYAAETTADAIAMLDADSDIEAVFINTGDETQIDALGLAKLIKARKPGIEILIASARVDRLEEFPPCVFLSKPLNPSTLVSMIEHAVRTRPTSDRNRGRLQ
jgi:DNA-binding NtrC family response regulator